MSGYFRNALAALARTTGAGLVGLPAGTLAGVLAAPAAGSANYEQAGALHALKTALRDDFHAAVNIRLIGDSITWGMTATGNGTQDPRAHALTDVRDVLTSKSWANLFRDWLGKSFAAGALVDSGGGVGSYARTVEVSCESPRVVKRNAAGDVLGKAYNVNAGHIFGTAIDLLGTAGSKHGIEFDFIGSSLTVIYTQLPVGTNYELFLNGASQGLFSTNGAATFNLTRVHNFTHGTYRVRIANPSANGADQVRIAGFTWAKNVKVANDGLIGTNTDEWLSTGALLPAAVQASDEFVFVMLGTNDRGTNTAPLAASRTERNLTEICTYLTAQGKKVVLMAANAVTQSEAAMYFPQSEMVQAVARVGADLGLDVIDHFRATDPYRQAALTFLADGLHPDDAGHELIFKNMVRAIEQALPVSVPSGGTPLLAAPGLAGAALAVQTVSVTANAVPAGKSNQTLTMTWDAAPIAIVGVTLRTRQEGGAWGSVTFTQDAGDNPGGGVAEPATDGGAKAGVNASAWVMRLFPDNSGTPNLRLGFVNGTGGAINIEVELTIAYLVAD